MSASSRQSDQLWQATIIGGGIAGPVAAIHLARKEVQVALFEKNRGPCHKVCGEFISNEGVAQLEACGVDFARLGAMPIRGFRLHGPHRSCESELPSMAMGLSRFALDEELLRLAEQAGATVRRGVSVTKLTGDLLSPEGTFTLETSDGSVRAERLIVATGKTEFRSVQNREGRDSEMVGFKMHLRLKPSLLRRLRGHCDLFVFEGGYGGLAPIENNLANFCFVIRREVLREIGSTWDALAYHIAKHNWEASLYLDGAQPQMKNFATVAHVPYGFVRRAPAEPGVYCVGDQMAVIPSLTGDGMSIAVLTAQQAASAIADARGELLAPQMSAVYQKSLRRRLQKQVDAAYAMHLLFKRPQACDWATYVVRLFPRIVDLSFSQTRCRPESLLKTRDRKSLPV